MWSQLNLPGVESTPGIIKTPGDFLLISVNFVISDWGQILTKMIKHNIFILYHNHNITKPINCSNDFKITEAT